MSMSVLYEDFIQLPAAVQELRAEVQSIRNILLNQNQLPEENLFITKKEAARMFSVSLETIHKWGRDGKITRHYIGGCVRFKKSELIELMEQGSGEVSPHRDNRISNKKAQARPRA